LYLRDWPRERYIELAPKYWVTTRARLVPLELAQELGPLTIPPKIDPAPAPTEE
jgi:hypothetical protein